jgi:acetylornithine deacetylase/succinyl-diaminopimelate desuccinylase-like protein
LTFERRNGRLTGPGIGDNAVAVVAVIHALSALLARGIAQPGAVAFTVGEEGLGDLRGAHQACEQLRPASVIAVEGHGLEQVLVDAVGSVRLRLRVGGPGGHSWEDRGTPSAIHALLQVGAQLATRGSRETPVNIGLVSGGQSINSIAAEAELFVEMRALDEGALEQFEADLRDLALDPPLSIVPERVGRRPAGRLDRNDPLLQTILGVRATLGLPDTLGAGSTDANAALVRAIPAVTLGIARGGLMHTPNEWLEEASIALGLRQLDAVLATLLGPLDGSSDPG